MIDAGLISAKFYRANLDIINKSILDLTAAKIPVCARPDIEVVMLHEVSNIIFDLYKNVDERIKAMERGQ